MARGVTMVGGGMASVEGTGWALTLHDSDGRGELFRLHGRDDVTAADVLHFLPDWQTLAWEPAPQLLDGFPPALTADEGRCRAWIRSTTPGQSPEQALVAFKAFMREGLS